MSISGLIQDIATLLYVAIIIRVLLSWFPQLNQSNNPLVKIVYPKIVYIVHIVTEPILAPIRRFMPRSMAVDLSPMIAIFLISGVQSLLAFLLRGI